MPIFKMLFSEIKPNKKHNNTRYGCEKTPYWNNIMFKKQGWKEIRNGNRNAKKVHFVNARYKCRKNGAKKNKKCQQSLPKYSKFLLYKIYDGQPLQLSQVARSIYIQKREIPLPLLLKFRPTLLFASDLFRESKLKEESKKAKLLIRVPDYKKSRLLLNTGSPHYKPGILLN